MPFGIGHWELLILVAVLVLIFGTSKVPKIARELGSGIREMRKTVADVDPRTPLRELEAPPSEERDTAEKS